MKLEEVAHKKALQQEVKKLAQELVEEEELAKALSSALNGRLDPSLIPTVRPDARTLLAQVAKAEDEINKMERQINQLKLKLWEERIATKEREIHQKKLHRHHHLRLDRSLLGRDYNMFSKSVRHDIRPEKIEKPRTSVGSAADTFSTTPNDLSEELLKCLIAIYSGISRSEKSDDPYGTVDMGNVVRDAGPYKDYVQLGIVGKCSPGSFWTNRIRVLMHRLRHVDLTKMGYKEKLAFWINIYNASVMRAFLKYGVPTSQGKVADIRKKAEVNVGGTMLHSSAIEHIILRHPSKGPQKKKEEVLLQQAYGLGHPEPNVAFALCRGSWSSPALRIYTAEGVVNELGRAKVEYLEASIGVTSKRIIFVPKLLEWHMKEFAEDMESLIEWVYSQLPKSVSLKKAMAQCLKGEAKTPKHNLAQIQPYDSKFRYLLSHV